MATATDLNPRIVEGLYSEALALSEDVRAMFVRQERRREDGGGSSADLAQSCEALRTTTRMMHAVAWLLNHRAYFAGELSEFQLRRYGRLVDLAQSDRDRLALLSPEMRNLIEVTERFHARLKRLDNGWRESRGQLPSAIGRLRELIALQA